MGYRVIVADKHRAFREQISMFLTENYFEVVAQASNGRQAKEYALQLKPDLVFLNVDLPEIAGVDLAKQLHQLFPRIGIVFISESPEYAYFAFELEAIDFLIKPLYQKRLYQCFKKIMIFFNGNTHLPLIKTNKIGVRIENEIELVDQNQIIFISSEKRETKVYIEYSSGIKVIKILDSLRTLEDKLNSCIFIRTHRSFIININHVHKIYSSGQTYIVTFKCIKEYAQISKNLISEIYRLLNII